MPTYEETVAVLIPVLEEDYPLMLTVSAIAPQVDEVWIHDDGSGEETAQTIDYLRARFPNVRTEGTAENRGRVYSITSLLASCRARHVLVLDADCVLCDDRKADLGELITGSCPCALLGFSECWGDFRHTRRQETVSYDSLCYVDRVTTEYTINQLGPPTYHHENVFSRAPTEWPDALFFHMTGVRDDRRLALRSLRWSIHKAGRPANVRRWDKFARLTDDEIHRRAMRFLFHDGLGSGELRESPLELVPLICREHERFELLFNQSGRPYDRIDHGWSLPGEVTGAYTRQN